jgi:hypothetical protein
MATVTTGYNWSAGETVTAAKLNSTAAPTVVVADNEVTTAKILDANVTNAKLATGIDASKLTTGTLPIARIADAAVTPAKLAQPLTLATAQNTTSGTSIDFTGIPSWVKRITVMFSGVSTNGTSSIQVQLGAGSVQTTNYVSSANSAATSTSGLLATNGAAAANTYQGSMLISLLGSNVWVASCVTSRNDAITFSAAGSVTLSGTLDRLRITTFNGSDTFDAGSVNIMYEG